MKYCSPIKALVIVFTWLAVNILAKAQNADNELSKLLVSRAETVIKQAAIPDNPKNPDDEEAAVSETCLSPIITKAKQNWQKLTPLAQNFFKTFSDRPFILEEKVTDTQHFRVHYTIKGIDAVPVADGNNNAIPDYIDKLAEVVEYVYVQYENRRYIMPPPDSGEGGNDSYDIYVQDIGEGLYGFVSPENEITDNPSSAELREVDAHTSWMAMNNNYAWAGSIGVLGAMRVTVAHEFFHAVQMGIAISPSEFLQEGTATWVEDDIFPNLDDNIQYLKNLLALPDVALNWSSADGSNYYGHWYGSWLFFRYLSEHKGGDIIRRIYLRCIENDEMPAVEAELAASGTSLKEMLKGYWVANSLLSSNKTFEPYAYARANTYLKEATMKTEKSLSFLGDNVSFSSFSSNKKLMRLSADQIRINAAQAFKISLIPVDKNADLGLVIFKKSLLDNKLQVVDAVKTASGSQYLFVGDYADFEQIKALVIRYDSQKEDTVSAQYNLYLEAASAEQLNQTFSSYGIKVMVLAGKQIKVETLGGAGLQQLYLTDTKGKLLINITKLSQKNLIVDARKLNKGKYMLCASTNDGIKLVQVVNLDK